MKSWTSIPFYLWKNTSRRWFEHPVSPVSKMLIPALLAALAALVLTFFGEIERELQEQLARKSAFVAIASEYVAKENAATLLASSFEEEIMWGSRQGSGQVRQVMQPLSSATYGERGSAPILAYSPAVSDLVPQTPDANAPPTVWFLASDAREANVDLRNFEIAGRRVSPIPAPIPSWVSREMAMGSAVCMPDEMVLPLLLQGYIRHTVAQLESLESLRTFVRDFDAYHAAEERQVKIVSSLEILAEIERISGIQAVVRSIIVAACGLILSLTLGSLTWLEYRQDIYLLALLRSFGTPRAVLAVHLFFENLVLVLAGLAIVWACWKPVYQKLHPQMAEIGFTTERMPVLDTSDAWMILTAAILGVVIALIPVMIGMRKPSGLVLQ